MNSLQWFAVTILLLLAAWFCAAQLESIAGMALCILAALITGMRALVVNHGEHTS